MKSFMMLFSFFIPCLFICVFIIGIYFRLLICPGYVYSICELFIYRLIIYLLIHLFIQLFIIHLIVNLLTTSTKKPYWFL